jgi:hypothetical protein
MLMLRSKPRSGWQQHGTRSFRAMRSVARRNDCFAYIPCVPPTAFKLSAALIAANHDPATLDMVCLDSRLTAAARREGFTVIDS